MVFEDFDPELHKIRMDDDPANGKFVGYANSPSSLESEPVWLIKRIAASGNFTSVDYTTIDPGKHTSIWNNRTSLFGAAPFNDAKSILTNAANEYISFGDVAALKFTNLTPFSISVWFKTFAGGTICLLGKQGAGNTNGYRVELTAGRIDCHLSGGALGNRIEIRSPTATYNNGAWHHLVFGYNGDNNANNCRMTVDGVAIAYTVFANTLVSTIDTASVFQVSGRNLTLNPWNGFLDETSVWSINLTLLQAQTIYGTGAPSDLAALAFYVGNIRHWCRLGDNAAFPTFSDISGFNNHGTAVNMTINNIVSEVP